MNGRGLATTVENALIEALGGDRFGQNSVTPASRAAITRFFSEWRSA